MLLLRVAARLARGINSRVGLYVVRQARTPAIRAFFIGSSGGAPMLNRDVRARRQPPPRAELRHSILRQYETGIDDEGKGRQIVAE